MSELAGAIEVVVRAVQLAADRGDGVGHAHLLRRLKALGYPPRTRTKEQAAINLAHECWKTAISDGLVAESAQRVLGKLRERRREAGLSDEDDPWVTIDNDRFEAKKKDVAAEVRPSIIAAIRACRRYEQTRRPGHFHEAVRILEEAVETERSMLGRELRAELCDAEARCLGEVLAECLPDSAFWFFARTVREFVARETAGPRARARTTRAGRDREEQWLSLPTWAVRRDDEEWATGAWFVPWLQARYDMEMEDARRARETQARERQDQARRLQEWQALRDEEAKLKAEPDAPREVATPGRRPGRGRSGARGTADERRNGPRDREGSQIPAKEKERVKGAKRITVHFIDDGLTALGRLWYRGMQLTLTKGSEEWERTVDREGNSWLDMTEDDQLRRYGRVFFRPGPWPGEPWQPEERDSFVKDYSRGGAWEG